MLDIEAASGTLAVLGFATMQLRDLHAVHTGRPVSGQRYHLAIQRSTVALHVATNAGWLLYGWLRPDMYVLLANAVYAVTNLFLCVSPRVMRV